MDNSIPAESKGNPSPRDLSRSLSLKLTSESDPGGQISFTALAEKLAAVQTARLRVFRWENRRFVLRESVVCLLTYEGGLWVYKCPVYKLHAFSQDRSDALLQFNEEFAFRYDCLINEPDDNLTIDAIQLRDRFKADIAEVEDI